MARDLSREVAQARGNGWRPNNTGNRPTGLHSLSVYTLGQADAAGVPETFYVDIAEATEQLVTLRGLNAVMPDMSHAQAAREALEAVETRLTAAGHSVAWMDGPYQTLGLMSLQARTAANRAPDDGQIHD